MDDYPWPGQTLSEEIIKNASGIDLFIGDQAMRGKGLVKKIVQNFIESHIWPKFQYCIVDPDVKNIAGVCCYEKLKFEEHAIIETKDALNRPVTLKLMILRR